MIETGTVVSEHIFAICNRKSQKSSRLAMKFGMNFAYHTTIKLVKHYVRNNGKRSISGLSVSPSEAESHWRKFLSTPKQRELNGLNMIIADIAMQGCLFAIQWGAHHSKQLS